MIKNEVRIIGGKFRARRIQFPSIEEIRPSTDRLRVTLFNWLQTHLYQAHCLDAFAGSGVLGFEAISRGATSCTFIDQNTDAVRALKQNAEKLHCLTQCQVYQENTLKFLENTAQRFDLIFLDPPFHSTLLAETLKIIEQRQLAKKFIYIESSLNIPELLKQSSYQLWKETRMGQVNAMIYETSAHKLSINVPTPSIRTHSQK